MNIVDVKLENPEPECPIGYLVGCGDTYLVFIWDNSRNVYSQVGESFNSFSSMTDLENTYPNGDHIYSNRKITLTLVW